MNPPSDIEPAPPTRTTADLRGRVAVVTGASRGIGLAIARALHARGATMIITARRPEPLRDAARQLGTDRVHAVAGHVADPDHRAEVAATALARYGALDILVNNTGVNPHYGPLAEIDADTFSKVLDTNIVSTMGWIQQAHRSWMADHGGAIVNVTSVAGLRPAPMIGAYAVSKAALIHLTAQIAVELGPRVRVNAVAPAVVRTSFAERLFEDETTVAAGYPLGRIGEPGDVAGAVCFLLSDDAAWITGQTLVVDGGLLQRGGVESA